MSSGLLYSKDMGALSDFLVNLMNEVGYGICHQISSRSLHFGGRALPVCARDTGIFVGFAACFIFLLVAYRGRAVRYPSWVKTLVLALMLAPTFIDAVSSYAGWRTSSNPMRLVTGALAGTAVAALLFPLTSRCIAALRHRDCTEPARMLEEPWKLVALIIMPVLVSLAMWPSSWGYWLWAPVVTLSILGTLFALNFTLVALLLEWWRGLQKSSSWAICICVGLGLAALELAASNRLHWLVDRLA